MTPALKLALLVLGFLVFVIALGLVSELSQEQAAPEVVGETSRTVEPRPTTVPEEPRESDYSISVKPEVVGPTQVQAEISTNIPGRIEVMASLSLAGQSPEDTYIGTSRKVTITDGTGQVSLDASKLPKGRYDFEVSFYPRWGFKDERSRMTGIQDSIQASSPVELTGSGELAETVALRENGQRWVMENVNPNMPWNPTFWKQKFGDYQAIPVDRFNPQVIKAYYFDAIDMTIFVNVRKSEVSHWRRGKASH